MIADLVDRIRWGLPDRRRVVWFLGRWAVTLGLLTAGFGIWQTWGTGVLTSRSQDRLEDRFDADRAGGSLAGVLGLPEPAGAADPSGSGPGTTTPLPDTLERGSWLRVADDGSAAYLVAPLSYPVARITIKSIGLSQIVVLGDRHRDLKNGPGMAITRAAPGSLTGNTVIPGHRTTYGAPFAELDKIELGDKIQIETIYGVFDYMVRHTEIVNPGDRRLMDDTRDHQLTLYTCHPRYSSRKRLLVIADPVSPIATIPILLEEGDAETGPAPDPAPAPAGDPGTSAPAGEETTTTTAGTPPPDAVAGPDVAEEREATLAAERRWSRDPLQWLQAAAWFALFAAARQLAVRAWTGRLGPVGRRSGKAVAVAAAVAGLAAVTALYLAMGGIVPAGL